jgi:hypothetical protein
VQPAENQPTFPRNISPPSSSFACQLLHPGFLFGLLFDLEDRGDIFLRKGARGGVVG